MKRPVKVYPNEIGIVYRNQFTAEYQRFTWLEWYKRTCKLANALKKLGINPGKPGEPGDRVGTMALNTHRHMELYYAVPCSGAMLHPINVRLAMEHIIYTINHAEDKIIFFDDLLLPMVEGIYDQVKDKVKMFVYMSDKRGLPKSKIENLYEYEALLEAESETLEWPHLHEDTYATLCYTTATTGLPKGAMFTHRALYLQTIHLMAMTSINNDPGTVYRRRKRGAHDDHASLPYPCLVPAFCLCLRCPENRLAGDVYRGWFLRSGSNRKGNRRGGCADYFGFNSGV